MCAGNKFGDGPCHNDAGAPLLYTDSCKLKLSYINEKIMLAF
jgi:hypothetical protein